jgi:hypothetical protein
VKAAVSPSLTCRGACPRRHIRASRRRSALGAGKLDGSGPGRALPERRPRAIALSGRGPPGADRSGHRSEEPMMPYSSARCHGNSVLFVEEIPSRTRGGCMGLFPWIPRIFTDVPGLCGRNPSSTPDSPTGMARPLPLPHDRRIRCGFDVACAQCQTARSPSVRVVQ